MTAVDSGAQGRGGPGLGGSGEVAAGLRARQRRATVCRKSGQWWHKRQRKLKARKLRGGSREGVKENGGERECIFIKLLGN